MIDYIALKKIVRLKIHLTEEKINEKTKETTFYKI